MKKKEYDEASICKYAGLTLYFLSALSLAVGLFFQFFPNSKQAEKLVIAGYIILVCLTFFRL